MARRIRVGDEVLLTPEDEVGRVRELRPGGKIVVEVTSTYGDLAGRTVVRDRTRLVR